MLALAFAAPAQAAGPARDAPSRPPLKGCAWEKLAEARAGVAAWVQRCDFGFRKIDFVAQDGAIAVRFSDGGDPYAVVESIALRPGETAEAAMKRAYLAHTDAGLAARCMLVPFNAYKTPPGARHYVYAPKPDYRRELKAKANPNEVGDPPCGDWGIAPDGIQYFEVRPADKSRALLFVRVGQDQPLFDEMTLRPLPGGAKP